MEVKFTDHGKFWAEHKEEYLNVFDKAMEGAWQGDATTKKLERHLINLTGAKDAIMVGSGTEALYLSLRALDDGSDKREVILPAFSFVATASAVVRAAYKPVFVDVDADGFIDITKATNAVTDKTAFILPVSMWGANGNNIVDGKVDTYGLHSKKFKKHAIIWDDAQIELDGAVDDLRFKGVSCISFDPMKNVPAFGSAGVILNNGMDDMFGFLIRGLRKNSPNTPIPSQNSQVPSLISAGLLYYLKNHRVNHKVQQHKIRGIYRNYFSKYMIKMPKMVVQHKFPIKCDDMKTRDRYATNLAAKGIETKVHYGYVLPALPQFGGTDATLYPNAFKLSQTLLSLPCHHNMTVEQATYVIDCFDKIRI